MTPAKGNSHCSAWVKPDGHAKARDSRDRPRQDDATHRGASPSRTVAASDGTRKPGETTTRMDHVPASRGFHDRVPVRAMNGADEWGPGDHRRVAVRVFRTRRAANVHPRGAERQRITVTGGRPVIRPAGHGPNGASIPARPVGSGTARR